MFNTISSAVNEHIRVYLGHIFKFLLSHDTILNNEIDKLQEFADMCAINLYIYIIKPNGGDFLHVFTTTAQKSGESSRAFLVFDKANRNCYPFYIYNNQHKTIQTVFPKNDTYTVRLFEDLVASYNWPDHCQTRQEVDQQNDKEVTTNVDRHREGMFND